MVPAQTELIAAPEIHHVTAVVGGRLREVKRGQGISENI